MSAGAGTGGPHIGVVLNGQYRIDEPLGEGAMGVVYRGTQLSMNRDVAIKLLKHGSLDTNSELARFRREAEVMSRLRSPSTVAVLDVGVHEGQLHYIVTDLIRGRTLDRLMGGAPLEIARTLDFLHQIASALAEAHEHQIIHRDIKAQNLMVEVVAGKEIVKVLDFGIAHILGGSNFTEAGGVVGTPSYISPEQVRGTALTGQVDIYSLGVVAYECLTGTTPFKSTTPQGMLMQHAFEQPPALPSTVPEGVAALVLRMLEKNPSARPAGARALREELEQLMGRTPSKPSSEPVSAPPKAKEPLAQPEVRHTMVAAQGSDPAWSSSDAREDAAEPGAVVAPPHVTRILVPDDPRLSVTPGADARSGPPPGASKMTAVRYAVAGVLLALVTGAVWLAVEVPPDRAPPRVTRPSEPATTAAVTPPAFDAAPTRPAPDATPPLIQPSSDASPKPPATVAPARERARARRASDPLTGELDIP